MSDVIRVFVEKRKGFDVEAGQILADLRDNLGLTGIEALRLVNRYDVEGLSAEEFEQARGTVFSEPNADVVYDETLPVEAGWQVFAMEYLPGQYDQRADSAAQCVQLLTQGERPQVATAKVICLKGDLSPVDFERVQDYLINPVESRRASLEKPETVGMTAVRPDDVARVTGFTAMTEEQIAAYWQQMGFAMSVADLAFCRDYFRDEEHRDPSVTELRVIDTYWSDHCRHTTFLTRLEEIEVQKGALSGVIEDALAAYYAAREEVYGARLPQKNVCLMDMATMGMRLLKKQGKIPDLDESDEINACSIEVPVVIDGKTEKAVLRDVQFHPIREEILHMDFYRVQPGKPVAISIPVRLTGNAEGVKIGGKLVLSARKLTVSAQLDKLPDELVIDVTPLGVGKTIFVGDLNFDGVKFLTPATTAVCAVRVTRASRGADAAAAK